MKWEIFFNSFFVKLIYQIPTLSHHPLLIFTRCSVDFTASLKGDLPFALADTSALFHSSKPDFPYQHLSYNWRRTRFKDPYQLHESAPCLQSDCAMMLPWMVLMKCSINEHNQTLCAKKSRVYGDNWNNYRCQIASRVVDKLFGRFTQNF